MHNDACVSWQLNSHEKTLTFAIVRVRIMTKMRLDWFYLSAEREVNMTDNDTHPVGNKWKQWIGEYNRVGDTLGLRIRRLRTVHLSIDSQAEFASRLWLSSRRTVEQMESSIEAKDLSTDTLVRLQLFLSDSKFKRADDNKKELVKSIENEVSAELSKRRQALLEATYKSNERRRQIYHKQKTES